MIVRGPFAYLLAALLIVSLAVNFLMLGFAVARYQNFDDRAPIERIVALGANAFPSELRHTIGGELDRHRGALDRALRDLGEARREMFRQMAAEPLDRDALDAAFRDVRKKTDELLRLGQELVKDALANAPPEERAKIRPPKRWRH